MLTLEEKKELLLYEAIQCFEEGKEIDEKELESLKKEIQSIKSEKGADRIYNLLLSKRIKKDWRYIEPSEFIEIKKLINPPSIEESFNLYVLKNKIAGGWIGKIVGNMLGKPVEGWSRKEIIDYLKLSKAFPLEDYIPKIVPKNKRFKLEKVYLEKGLRGKIVHALRDDDIDYAVINLELLEEKGFKFTSEDVGLQWINKIPYAKVYTAERAAYRNIILGLKPPQTAIFWNPFREWIGAQIRADVFGYVNPSNPFKAIELAYEDAKLSHTKNGIYGEMFIASTISASFVMDDVLEAIEVGKACIPNTSRLYEAINDCISSWKKENEFEESYTKLMEKYGKYHKVHTISNEIVVILSLLYGELDFSKSIALAVTSGLDTDCNASTVGSIVGIMVGEDKIENKWKAPLNDRVELGLSGHKYVRISNLINRTMKIIESLNERH